jgi:hypothetical protein
MPKTIILNHPSKNDDQADNPVVRDWLLCTQCNLLGGSLILHADLKRSDAHNLYTVPDGYPEVLHLGDHTMPTPAALHQVNEWNEWVISDSGWLFYGINESTLAAYAFENLPSPRPLTNLSVRASPEVSMASLTTHLDITNLSLNKVTCLDGLDLLSDLKSLNITLDPGLTSLNPLSRLRSLTSLKIEAANRADPWDLLPLASLKKLEILNLCSFSNQIDYTPIAALTKLHTLSLLYSFKCSDLSPLAALTNMIRLELTGSSGLTDLSPLEPMNQLQELNLTCCTSLQNLEPLGCLQNLQNLNLSFCEQVADLTPLARLPYLNQLFLTDCWRVKPAVREAAENSDFNLFRSLVAITPT